MDFQAFKEAVIAAAKAEGIAEYELYYTSSESVNVSAFLHEINEFTSSNDGGVCFRCIVDGKMGYASTEALNAEQAVSVVRRAAANAAVLETEEQVFLCEGGKTYEPIPEKHVSMPTTEALVKTVLDGQDALYAADPAVVDGCGTRALGEKMEIAIVNSKGMDLHYENTVSGMISIAVVASGAEKANSYEVKVDDLSKIDIAQTVSKAVKSAKEKLGADVAPTAVCPVMFSPDAMASLLATYSSVFSSEAAQKGLSQLAGKEGEVIASPAVTLIDDPFCKMSSTPINFDAEGSPTCRKNVIDGGKLVTLLYNMKTAAVAGKQTTGNAAKSGYNAPVAIRPFSMYLAPGALSEEELLEKMGSGVYINSLGGLHAGANVISGDFSLQSAGFMVENGKKTKAVNSFTVAGNFFQVLKDITDVGSNLELNSTGGITAFGSPSVLVAQMPIAGK